MTELYHPYKEKDLQDNLKRKFVLMDPYTINYQPPMDSLSYNTYYLRHPKYFGLQDILLRNFLKNHLHKCKGLGN